MSLGTEFSFILGDKFSLMLGDRIFSLMLSSLVRVRGEMGSWRALVHRTFSLNSQEILPCVWEGLSSREDILKLSKSDRGRTEASVSVKGPAESPRFLTENYIIRHEVTQHEGPLRRGIT